MSTSELVAWGENLIDCSVPGMGVELPIPAVQADVTRDGTKDVIVSLECVTGDASSFSHVVALDGASSSDRPEIIELLIELPKGKDYRRLIATGLKVRKVSVDENSITIVSDKWRNMDSKACPSLRRVDVFGITGNGLKAEKPLVVEKMEC
ncbi:hypothetical protein ACLVWQ_11520 [Streptomyces sp. CWNU-52B]|uniref:hypothetical protein n=1 Tax=unclassified Streptomyces TaxID=2593676 RepID=UPI0039C01AB9